MTIIEAIKSGKRFRRPRWDKGVYNLPPPTTAESMYSNEDILATDWEIEVVKKELSGEDIRTANAEMLRTHGYGCTNALNLLISKLGLE